MAPRHGRASIRRRRIADRRRAADDVALLVDITRAIVTVGQFEAGVRNNIIPDSAASSRVGPSTWRCGRHPRARAPDGAEDRGRAESPTCGSIAATRDLINNPERRAGVAHAAASPARSRSRATRSRAPKISYFQQQVPGLFVPVRAAVSRRGGAGLPAVLRGRSGAHHGRRALHLAADYLSAAR